MAENMEPEREICGQLGCGVRRPAHSDLREHFARLRLRPISILCALTTICRQLEVADLPKAPRLLALSLKVEFKTSGQRASPLGNSVA